MKQSTKNLIRWVAVLPGALIAGFLSTFPLHWILYLAFAHNGTLLGFIELPDGANISIEQAVYPFVIAITFVLVGAKIAPSHKFKTAITLVCLWIASFVGIFLFMSNQQVQFGARGVGSIAGSLLGLIINYFSKNRDVATQNTINKAGDGGPRGKGGDVHIGPGTYKAGDLYKDN